MIIDYASRKKSPAQETPTVPLLDRFPAALGRTAEQFEKTSYFKSYLLEHFHGVAQKAFKHVRFSVLNSEALTESLNELLESDLNDLTAPNGFTLLMAIDEQDRLYNWRVHILNLDDPEEYVFSSELSRSMPPDPLFMEFWNEDNSAWKALDPWDSFDFDQELMKVYKSGGPAAALFLSAVTPGEHEHLTVEAWEQILEENRPLLQLAKNLEEDEIIFSRGPEGFVLLPAWHHLTGLAIRNDQKGLILLQFIPEHPLQLIENLVSGKNPTYTRDIERVSQKEALELIRASDYGTQPEIGFYSLLLPLSKKRLVFCRELPTQLEGPRYPMPVKEKNLTPKEAEALKAFRALLDIKSVLF